MDFLRYSIFFRFKKTSLCLLLVFLLNSGTLLADDIHYFDIPAQSLNNGLVQFAAESKLDLIFSVDDVRGLKCNALKGNMTSQQALEQLLLGSGYQYQFIDSNTITLIPKVETISSPPEQNNVNPWHQTQSIKVLQPLIVEGKLPAFKGKEYASRPYQISRTRSATRTETAIKQIPQSIQVITRSLIDDQGSLSISESLKNISGVAVGQTLSTPSFDFTQIRGFRAEQLLDGFTQYYNAGDRESLVNVERIEVLKGSNALLYGGGSGAPPGGLVNIVSKVPEQEVFAEAGVKYGSYQYYQPYFDVNQPLNDHLLFRITGEYTHAGSYLDVIETERYNANPALTITDNQGTQFTIQGKLSSWEQVDYQGLPAHGTVMGDFSIQPERYIGPRDIEPSQAKFYGVWGTLEHEINESWLLSLKARYSQSKFDQKIQTLFGADGIKADRPFLAPSTWALFNTQLYQEQQELSFVANIMADFKAGPTKNTLLFGVDYSQFEDEGFIESNAIPLGFVDLNSPQFNLPYRQPGLGINNIFVINKTYGGYIQLQSTVYDRLHILAGARLGVVDIDYNNESPGFKAVAKTSKVKFLPRVGASFDLTDDVSSFISYSEGMRGQPFVNFVGTPAPELSQHIEAGIKFDFLSSFNGQIAVYQINRTHVAIRDNTDVQGRSETTGEQRSQGIETDLTWQLESISLLGSYAYTDAHYVKHQIESLNGQPLPHIPSHSGKLWANYQFKEAMLSGFSLGAGVYFQSGVYLEIPNYNKSDSLYSVDAALNYEADNFKVSAAFKNITNEKSYQSLNYFGGRFIPVQPISAYISLSLSY